MQIVVKKVREGLTQFGQSGEEITVEVEGTDTIAEVKAKIKEKKGIHPDKQCLTFDAQYLQDPYTVSDYKIQQSSTIFLAISCPPLCGCFLQSTPPRK